MHRDTLDFDRSHYHEVWGLAHSKEAYTYDRLFESHSPEIIRKHGPKHLEKLRELAEDVPLYSPWPNPGTYLPHCRLWNITRHFESSIAYPLAYAISLDPEEIGLYGISMAGDEEYAYQRPNTQYLVGIAQGRGIRVNLHPKTELFSSQWTAGVYGHPDNIDDIEYHL